MMFSTKTLFRGLAVATMVATMACAAHAENEDYARWYFSPRVGGIWYEGDEPLDNGFLLDLSLGYDFNEWWSAEAGWIFAPSLDEDTHKSYRDGTIRDRSNTRGDDSDFGDTWMSSFYADALFHFTRLELLDPYLAFGAGVMYYGKDVLGSQIEAVLRTGAGVMFHLTDSWALRGDWRLFLTSDNTEFNSIITVGLCWHWGASVDPDFVVSDGPIDSDGDGLSDLREEELGTDPYDPDTDKDGLTDGEEVLTYKTDPLNPDSDYDGLLDGEEVRTYKTDPLDPDTDKGGVKDGHEVHHDRTNPLDGTDDLMMFELRIQFDYDKSVIKPEYFDDLAIIAKVLQVYPESTAVIEGHCDQMRTSRQAYNQRLSERRAKAVLDHLVAKGGIAASRLTPVGYGFSRPNVKPDIVNGTPENRRVEVYIKDADGQIGKARVIQMMRQE
ncbi:MAG: outer membrane beta-barrel protein [Kiritimatiellia bacterium]|jgi:OOP family OmpA-OmpF porin